MSKRSIKTALLLLAAAAVLAGACHKQGDPSRAKVTHITNNGCQQHTDAQALADKDTDDEPERVAFSYRNGVLTVTHYNILVNCAFESNGIDVAIHVDGDTVTIDEREHDGPMADCMCRTDNTFQIVDLPRGTYTFVFNTWYPSPYTCTYTF